MLVRYRSLTVYALLFGSLFISHIYFAANNHDSLFQLVVFLITVMSFFCGAICALFESNSELYGFVFQFGMIASIPICIGLGWAYNDMSIGMEIVIFPLTSVLLHFIIKFSALGDTYGLK